MGFHMEGQGLLLTFRPSKDVPDSPDWKAGTGEATHFIERCLYSGTRCIAASLPDVAAKSEVSAIMMWFEPRDGKQKAYYVVQSAIRRSRKQWRDNEFIRFLLCGANGWQGYFTKASHCEF